MRALHSPERIEQATRSSSCLSQAVRNASLKQRMGDAGFPSEAWKLIEDSYAPYGTSQRKLWRQKFSNIRMDNKEDPTNLARANNIVDILAYLGVLPSEEDINDAIVEGLTSDYDTECRAHFSKPGLTRNDIESVLRERHNRMARRANSGGRQLSLLSVVRPWWFP